MTYSCTCSRNDNSHSDFILVKFILIIVTLFFLQQAYCSVVLIGPRFYC